MGIHSQCIHISNHHIVFFKYIPFFLSIRPHQTERKKKYFFEILVQLHYSGIQSTDIVSYMWNKTFIMCGKIIMCGTNCKVNNW